MQSTCFLKFSLLPIMTSMYLTDARYGILSPAILKFQSGSLLLYHKPSHVSGENLRPTCIALVSIFFRAVVICSYNMSSPMDPLMDCKMISVCDHLYFATQVQL